MIVKEDQASEVISDSKLITGLLPEEESKEFSRNVGSNPDKSTHLPNQSSDLHASRLMNLSKEESKDGINIL